MSYPDIFVPLNLHGPPNIELDTMNFKEFLNRGPLKHTVDIHTGIPKKTLGKKLVRNWYLLHQRL